MPRALVTGITGFAGSHLAELLVGQGDEVHGIAHEPAPHAYLAATSGRIRMHQANVLDADALRDVAVSVGPEIVYHLAGQAVPTLASADPAPAVHLNVGGTANVARAALAAATRMVAASSADVYGVPEHVPCPEDAPLHPANVYAATKVAAEAVLRGTAGLGVTILRPCNQIGPRQHPRLAASEFAKHIAEAEAGLAAPVLRHGQLDVRREFVDVRDMARAYAAAARLASGTYNVGSGEAVAVGDLLGILIGLARIPIRTELDPLRVRSGVPAVLLLDSRRFRERTGWSPAIGLERSLSDTLAFWREHVRSAAATRS